MFRQIFIFPIKVYQKTISPLLGNHCRFYPSCSEYAIQSINKNGIMLGILKSIWRILRCNPLNKGGIDLP